MRSITEVMMACLEAFATSANVCWVMLIILWSKFLRASAKSVAIWSSFANGGGASPIPGVFDDLLVPPAFTEWVSGFGPVINEGAVSWPVIILDENTGSAWSWLQFAKGTVSVSSGTPCRAFQNSFINNGAAALTLSNMPAFTSINWPSGWGFPAVPVSLSGEIAALYTTLPGYQNFVPMEVTRFGLIDNMCVVVVSTPGSLGGRGDVGAFGFRIQIQILTEYLYAPRILAGPDIIRALSHKYRTVASTSVSNVLMPFNSSRVEEFSSSYVTAKYMSAGTGWTVFGEELANREAEAHTSLSVDGLTVAPKFKERSELATIRGIVSDLFTNMAQNLPGLSSKPIGEIAADALKSTARIITSEFLPFSGPILEAGLEFGANTIKKFLSRSEQRDVVRKPLKQKVGI